MCAWWGMTNQPRVDSLIAGALFDFAAHLTTRDEEITAGAQHDAAPWVGVLQEFADLRGLDIDDPAVLLWQEALPVPTARREMARALARDPNLQRVWRDNVAMHLYAALDCGDKEVRDRVAEELLLILFGSTEGGSEEEASAL